MNLLKSLVLISTAAGLMACQGSNSTPATGMTFDANQLKGAWQAVSWKDGKTGVQATADDKGVLTTPAPTAATAADAANWPKFDKKMFFTLDGAKINYLSVSRDGTNVAEDTQDYTIANKTFIKTKTKNADGSVSDVTYQVTRLVKNSMVLKDDQGTLVIFNRVTDADVQAAKNGATPAPGASPSPAPAADPAAIPADAPAAPAPAGAADSDSTAPASR